MALCSNCGQEAADDVFCGACGHKVDNIAQSETITPAAPPHDTSKWAPPAQREAASAIPPARVVRRRPSPRAETAAKVAAGGCGAVGVIVVIVLIGLIVALINFMNAISTPSDGTPQHSPRSHIATAIVHTLSESSE